MTTIKTKTVLLLGHSRQGSVTLAAVLQLLLAVTFLIMPTLLIAGGLIRPEEVTIGPNTG